MDSRFRGKDEERDITRNESHSGTENGPPKADKLFDQKLLDLQGTRQLSHMTVPAPENNCPQQREFSKIQTCYPTL